MHRIAVSATWAVWCYRCFWPSVSPNPPAALAFAQPRILLPPPVPAPPAERLNFPLSAYTSQQAFWDALEGSSFGQLSLQLQANNRLEKVGLPGPCLVDAAGWLAGRVNPAACSYYCCLPCPAPGADAVLWRHVEGWLGRGAAGRGAAPPGAAASAAAQAGAGRWRRPTQWQQQGVGAQA